MTWTNLLEPYICQTTAGLTFSRLHMSMLHPHHQLPHSPKYSPLSSEVKNIKIQNHIQLAQLDSVTKCHSCSEIFLGTLVRQSNELIKTLQIQCVNEPCYLIMSFHYLIIHQYSRISLRALRKQHILGKRKMSTCVLEGLACALQRRGLLALLPHFCTKEFATASCDMPSMGWR